MQIIQIPAELVSIIASHLCPLAVIENYLLVAHLMFYIKPITETAN